LPSEQPDILGCVWSSRLFSNRAPDGKILLTVFMAGSQNPQQVQEPDKVLLMKALTFLRDPMKLTGEPIFSRVTRNERAIPQYTIGHRNRIKLLEQVEGNFPGLFFRGNYRGGLSVSDVVKNSGNLGVSPKSFL